MKPEFESLTRAATNIRKTLIKMHFYAQSGHISTGLSCIDLMVYLHARVLNEHDRFILSKGHGASSFYATLHHFKKLNDDLLATYYLDNTLLPAHPAAGAFPELITAATGSLGHGLSIATGMAYAAKYLNSANSRVPEHVVALLSDGECNEGSVWEAALFAGHHGLNGLKVIIDANGLQGFGRTEEVMNLEPLAKKWQAFGFKVREVNGHNFEHIHQEFSPDKHRPLCLIARTIKGRGVSFMENQLEWHYRVLNTEQFHQAIKELDGDTSDAS